jgi:predicted RNA-binding Zn ribbon-like protein
MLNKIKNFLIAAAVAAAAYFIGKRNGKYDEKIKNLENASKNAARAASARNLLADGNFVQRLRKKYARK